MDGSGKEMDARRRMVRMGRQVEGLATGFSCTVL